MIVRLKRSEGLGAKATSAAESAGYFCSCAC